MAGIVVSNKVRRLVGNRLKEIDVPTTTLNTALYYADLAAQGASFNQSRVNAELNAYPVTVKNNASLALTPNANKEGVVYAMNGDTKTLEEFEFQRGSSATYFNASGVMQLAAPNVPRINFENGVAKGLLIEPSSSNLMLFSGMGNYGSFQAVYLPDREHCSVVVEDGKSAIKYSNQRYLRLNSTPVSENKTYTYSFWIKSSTPLILSFGHFGTNSYGVSASQVYTTWIRFTKTFTVAPGSTYDILHIGRGDSSTDVLPNIFIADIQVEEGSVATSYIPTTSAIATRLADKVLSKRPTVVFPKNSMNVKTSEWPATWMGNGVDLLSFVNKNLVPQNSILFTGDVQKNGAFLYNVKSILVNHGLKIPINKKLGNDYVLTFDLKYLSGTNFQNVGGNCVQTITKILVDNIQQNIQSQVWHTGISSALFSDNQWHTVSIFFKYDTPANNIIGIEVNRYVNDSWEIFFDVRNIRMTEGNTVSPLSPAPEDYIKVDANGNIEVSYDEPIHLQQLSLISRELTQAEV